MPYEIVENAEGCEDGYAVINIETSELMGCHTSESDAEDQLIALNIAEFGDDNRAAESFEPTAGMKEEAQRGLDWRSEFGRGGTEIGIARARDIVNGRNLPLETVKRMKAFFDRHQSDRDAEGWSPGEDGYPSNGRIAHALWGGDPGYTWAQNIVAANDERNSNMDTATDPTVETRDDCYRDVPFEVRSADQTGDGLTLSGYAAVFNRSTFIDNWEGRFEETIKPGAFKRSINAKTPVLQFEHGRHPLLGSMPLGQITKLREDDHGLYVEARLADNWLIQPVRDAIASGALDGMSFRFQVVRESWTERAGLDPLRSLEEVKLMELGPVVFPAYEATSVGVRSADLAPLLNLPADDRHAIARALVLGTSPEPVNSDTSEQPADSTPDPQPTHSGLTPHQRAAYLRQTEGVL